MLLEAAIAAGFFALAIPFGYLSRIVKKRNWAPVKKWSVFLGLVHTPVLPLIAFVKLGEVSIEFEILLVAVVLAGHVTGVLAHRQVHAARAKASAPAAAPPQ